MQRQHSSLSLKDRVAAEGGILFALVVCLAIVAMGTWLGQFTLEPEPLNEPFHYEWQLANPTIWSRATIWIGFALHQLAVWMTIYFAQKHYSKYTDRLRPVNIAALALNAGFIVLHYLQTYIFYDAIAQDIPSWTAQYAVIMMLVVILAMENKRRGMFFGRKVKFRQAFYDFLRRYHGYIFSFAVIYTFWFHPMVPTWGHLFGFAYVILVMVQGSLMFTRFHLNRRWTFLLEILVLPHAASVALNQSTSGLVWMFLFGFIAIFLVTQMHGLGLKTWVKNVFYASFALTVAYVYLVLRQPYQVNEVIRIPMIEYLTVFALYGLWLLGARIAGRSDRLRDGATAAPAGD